MDRSTAELARVVALKRGFLTWGRIKVVFMYNLYNTRTWSQIYTLSLESVVQCSNDDS